MKPPDLPTLRRHLRSGLPLVGSWLRRRALRGLAADGSAEAIRVLEDAVVSGPTLEARDAALESLRVVAARGNVPAREALCRLVIHHDHAGARRVVEAAGYKPHEEAQRAVFHFLMGQWDDYDALDFDRRWLRAAFDAAAVPLRRRIAAQARQAGRVEWVEVVSGGRQGKRLALMTDAEWHVALSVLADGGRYEELWRLAQDAPPRWTAAFLRRLHQVCWKPRKAEQAGFAELGRLATGWDDRDFALRLFPQATLKGHGHEIRCLALSPRGDLLVSGSADRTVRVWRLPGGQPLGQMEGHRGWINALAVAPDGRLLASAGRDGLIALWRLPSGTPVATLDEHTQGVSGLAVTPDGSLLVSGSADGTVRLWSLPDGKLVETLKAHELGVSCLAVTPDGSLLATGGADSSVRLWDLPSGRAHRTLDGHRDEEGDSVLSLAFDREGRMLASGGSDGAILFWAMPDGRLVDNRRAHLGNVNVLAASPGGDLLVSGGADNALRLWKFSTPKARGRLEGHLSEVAAVVISGDGRLLASGSGGLGFDHTVRVWDLEERRLVRLLRGHDRAVGCLALAVDGRLLASGSGDGTIRLWTPELDRLCRLPARQSTTADLDWVQQALAEPELPEVEQKGLAFLAGLYRWRRRTDILVDEAVPRVIEVGAFDIEIEG